MRLEVLITKYLDGELTVDEDRELRHILSQNPDAKSSFDQSISLHHALHKDADQIIPPPQLVRETEDRILMAIFGQPEPELQPEKKKGRRWMSLFSTGSRVLTGLVTLLIPFVTSSIGFERVAPLASFVNKYGAEEHQRDAIVQSTVPEENAFALRGNTGSAGQRRINAAERQRTRYSQGAGIGQRASVDAIAQVFSPVDNPAMPDGGALGENSVKEQRYQDFNSSGDLPLVAALSSSSDYPTLSGVSASLEMASLPGGMVPLLFGDKITLSTTFGHDALEVQSGDPLGLSFVSQSLAYSIGEFDNGGIEVGYMWFTYTRPVVRFIADDNASNGGNWDDSRDPYGYDSKPLPTKVQGGDSDPGGQVGVTPSPEFGDGAYVIDTQVSPKQTWWGAAFYERTFTHNERIFLQGRVGLGGSNDGALAYARATGQYRLLDNVSLSLGVDVRGMMLRTSYVNPNTSTIKTSLSLVYGLQVHL